MMIGPSEPNKQEPEVCNIDVSAALAHPGHKSSSDIAAISYGLWVVLIISGMSSGESGVQTWIDRGKEAYWHLHLTEAAKNFENAVATDLHSDQARLCFGVISLFLYQNGVSEAREKFLDPRSDRTWSRAEMAAEVERIRALIAEQNSTHGKRAEENLLQVLQLDPRNKLGMEYLAALYYAWLDPTSDAFGNRRRLRLADAQRWYKRILEIDPEHKFANYVCGVIGWETVFDLMRSSGTYPRPLRNEEARRSLREQIAPLLDDSTRNLLRSLESRCGRLRHLRPSSDKSCRVGEYAARLGYCSLRLLPDVSR